MSVEIERRAQRALAPDVSVLRGRPLKVALLGFGTVGASVARILTERRELADRLELTHVFNRNVSRKRVPWVPPSVTWTENIDEVFAAAPDVVVEAVGGVDPAEAWVRRALEAGALVVTANKLLLAAHGPSLIELAASRGGQIRFEAAVGGGIPLIHGIREGLAGDRLVRVAGILNGTCNYILSSMESDEVSMKDALADAQRRGYAEADPTSDVDGLDAAAKLVVLAGIAFGRYIRMSSVPRTSIRTITDTDFRYARRLGCTIRQIALAELGGTGESLHAFVGPALVPHGSGFARNAGANNVVTVSGQFGGASTFSGAGAGGDATAVAIVSDLLALTHHGEPEGAAEWAAAALVPPPARAYYLRFVVRDRPGILASIAAALAREDINLDAVLQEPGYAKTGLPFVITVEPCEERSLLRGLQEIAAADYHVDPPLALPILLDAERPVSARSAD